MVGDFSHSLSSCCLVFTHFMLASCCKEMLFLLIYRYNSEQLSHKLSVECGFWTLMSVCQVAQKHLGVRSLHCAPVASQGNVKFWAFLSSINNSLLMHVCESSLMQGKASKAFQTTVARAFLKSTPVPVVYYILINCSWDTIAVWVVILCQQRSCANH